MNDIRQKQKNSSKAILMIIGVLTFLLSTQAVTGIRSAHAQEQITSEYALLSPLPCLSSGCPGSNGSQTADFKTYVSYAYNLLIAGAAVIAVFMIVLGGFEYVTSTIPGVKTEGMKRIQNALWGLLLILGSYLILSTINPRLVQIPSTLVPQITIQNTGLTRNTSGDFYSQLDNEAAQYTKNNHDASAASVAARDAAAAAQAKLTDTNNQIMDALYADSPMTDQEIADACASSQVIQQLCADRANYTNQIAADKSLQSTQTLTADFSTALQNAASGSATVDVTTLKNMQNDLNIAYNTLRPTVTDPAQQQIIDSQYKFATGKLQVQTDFQTGNTPNKAAVSAAIADITNIRDTVAPQISNATDQANLIQSANNALTRLRTVQGVLNSNASYNMYTPSLNH